MKALQIKLALLLLLFTGIANAQIVNIPDANFKAKLLEANTNNSIASTQGQIINNFCSIDTNGDNEIQISEANEIKYLNISGSNISSLEGISNFTNMQWLNCSYNFLTNLDLTSLTQLIILECKNNLIINLNFNGLIHLESINCSNNQITSLNFNGLLNLNGVNCAYNQLTTLDFTNNPLFNNLGSANNNLLTSVYLKNGTIQNTFIGMYFTDGFTNCPNITFICVDEFEQALVQGMINDLSSFGTPVNAVVNSYCSFTPGGNYNTITGNLKFDANNNGCDANDLAQPSIRVNINDGTNTGASFTNTTGDYKFYTQAGSFDITPEIENPSFFNFTPTTATIPFTDNNNNTATQDFCFSANGVHPDLEVVLASIAPARPGFDATYQLVYKNKGNQTLSGSVNLVFDDAKTDFISANPAVDNLAVNSLTWNYNTLLPFESRSIDVVLNVNSPLETPAVNIGDMLNFTATINPISGDELPDDNTFDYNQTVVGSYDPNDITCLEGNSVAPSEIGEYLHYVINFENTGNYPAENVVVKTIVDTTKFDVNSLQLLNTSNPVDARITGNVVEFIFENIQLGGPGGHGHVLLKIKSKNTLVTGDEVAKSAGIYFDYNAPIDTGIATTIFQSLSNAIFEKDNSINVSPNPTSGIVTINSNFNIKKVELYDVQGRVLETHIGEIETFDISEKANGIYFLKITTEKGSKVEKVIKE